MLSFKKILFVFVATVFLQACMEQRLSFSFYNDKDADKDVFREIPGLGSSTYLKFPVTKKATRIQVYVSSFREKYIQKDHLLEFSELNDSSTIPNASYFQVDGYSQDLYILKYEFTYTVTEKGKSFDVPADAAVFFAVKHNGKGDTIGVTPCYFGIINSEDNVIAFDTKLSLKKDGSSYFLKLQKKKKNMNGILFMPADFPRNPKAGSKLTIEKIVKLDPGKVGGYKPLVFDVAKIFHDPNALQFHYETTLHFK